MNSEFCKKIQGKSNVSFTKSHIDLLKKYTSILIGKQKGVTDFTVKSKLQV